MVHSPLASYAAIFSVAPPLSPQLFSLEFLWSFFHNTSLIQLGIFAGIFPVLQKLPINDWLPFDNKSNLIGSSKTKGMECGTHLSRCLWGESGGATLKTAA